MVVGMIVPFFLAPFVVHHLGTVTYGVWILVSATISYLMLLDFGLRGAVIRYLAQSAARGEHDESRRTVDAALRMRLLIGAGILCVSVALAAVFPHLFKVPADLARQAQWAVLITGVNLALTMVGDTFNAVLSALNRYDLSSSMSALRTLLRAGGTVWLLLAGHGIVALAIWELVAAQVANGGSVFFSFLTYPQLRGPTERRPGTLRKLWNYSVYVFIIGVATQLVFSTDNVIVGAFVSAAAVTFYSIAGSLVTYGRQIVSSMSTTFMPLASGFEAEGRRDQLRRLLLRGTQLSLLLLLPISLALFFRGHTFVRLWMGAEYASVSGSVLRILLIYQVFSVADLTAGGVAYGMERHRPIAAWAIVEGTLNLLLSILLARHYGVYGVAWGTVVPGVFIHLAFWPRHVRRIVGVPVRDYLWSGWGRAVVAAAPYGFVCFLTDRLWPASSLPQFFLQIAAILPVFLLGVALMFWREARPLVRERLRALRAAA